MKRWMVKVLAGIILLAGIGLMAYPLLSNILFERQQAALADYYEQLAKDLPEEERSRHWDDAQSYNRALVESGSQFSDPFGDATTASDNAYNDLLNLNGDGAMGSMEIPGITGKLVIYHGTEEDALQKGVGHLQGSSLPVGGESTHCVLSAHTGLPSKKLFTNLDQMEIGDVFYLHILGEVLAYQVDQIEVILPHETEHLTIEPHEDFVTLVTCTPYGINTHRLLVRGTRIPYEEAKQIENSRQRGISTWLVQYLKAALVGLGIVLLGFIIWLLHRRRKKRKS